MGGQTIHEAIQTVAGVQIASVQYQPTDRPIEDRFSITASPDGARLILGVYDGHGGSATAEHISEILPSALLGSPVNDVNHKNIFEATDKAMLDAFRTDHDVFRTRSKDWRHHAQVLRSGCMALILDIDVPGRVVHYANAGDCRALVCDAMTSEAAEPLQQTTDLNAKSQSEQERLKAEHPNEDLLVVGGRLFGKLMSTRGFGDGYYKLPRGINGWQHKKYIDTLSSLDSGKVPLNAQYESYFYGYHTPPYIISTPDVGVMSLNRDRFVVCASDGLFDLASSEEVGRIIQQGIQDSVENLAVHLLTTVMAMRLPGDDVTILVLRFI
ncbi:phosphatase 2C-like domain-containing protein [Mycena crocata]|nr:phosphatase 2C-like domain-containing protein [Mycena crocata]